jgi:hypothetical protein
MRTSGRQRDRGLIVLPSVIDPPEDIPGAATWFLALVAFRAPTGFVVVAGYQLADHLS